MYAHTKQQKKRPKNHARKKKRISASKINEFHINLFTNENGHGASIFCLVQQLLALLGERGSSVALVKVYDPEKLLF
jgi:hypothetical protein